MNLEIRKFYDAIYGSPALAKFVDVGRRRGHSPEHTLTAARMLYELHIENPFKNPRKMGHLVHATAAKLQRQRTTVELDILELIKETQKKRTFRDKFNHWMRWGKWQ